MIAANLVINLPRMAQKNAEKCPNFLEKVDKMGGSVVKESYTFYTKVTATSCRTKGIQHYRNPLPNHLLEIIEKDLTDIRNKKFIS